MTHPDEIWEFPTRRIGRRVCMYGSVTSTNDLAAVSNEVDGTVFLAEHQTEGRGQYGRVWASRPNDSLLLSIRLQPPPALCRPAILTALAAVAVGDAILELSGAQIRIKWPNDLIIGGKKICGILIEQSHATVIGIGLNLNQSADVFRELSLPAATSLAMVTGSEVDRKAALATVVCRLDEEYDRLLRGNFFPLESVWKRRLGLVSRHVMIERMDGIFLNGNLRDMGFDGIELMADGEPVAIRPESIRHIHEV